MAQCRQVYNSTLPQESDNSLDSPAWLYGLHHPADCDRTCGWSSHCDMINGCSTCNGPIHSTTTSPLPHQPSAGWAVHGIGGSLHSRHICCPCSGGLRTAQTTVLMQSVLVDMWCIGAVARLWSLAAFSLSVLAIVQLGRRLSACVVLKSPLPSSELVPWL